MPGSPLGILLISGGHERAHYAFVLAAGAAAVGRAVTVFATNEGCCALSRDGVADAGRDAAVREAGVAGLDELRTAAAELGVRLMACDAGLRMAGLDSAALLPGVEVAGVPAFLATVGTGQIITL
ncbi:MAG TPA: DsrE/DsrF/DrsH-like family protein [Acetobacteraceae bacterium]